MTASTCRPLAVPHLSPRRPFDDSAPALVEMYAHKPLPPLPLNLRRQRTRSQSPQPLRACRTPDMDALRPRHVPALGSTPSSRRRSSYKVQQLTGYDVDVAVDTPPDSDSSSTCSVEWADDCYKLGARWASPSPTPGAAKAFRVPRAGRMASPRVQSAPGEEWMRRWDPSYGQFTDSRAAGEYHRFATEIAARHTGRQTEATAARRKRPSLSVNFGRGPRLAARRRNTSCPVGAVAKGGSPTPAPPTPRTTPVSAFESDSSDGEARAAGGIRDWFGRRSLEAGDAPRGQTQAQGDEAGGRASTGEQMRELLHHAKDRARLLHLTREERRREDARRLIRKLPC